MKLHTFQFLGLESHNTDFSDAAIAILPFGYEGGVSYGTGAAGAPNAILRASEYVELYDEELDTEPYKAGISTVEEPRIPADPELMDELIYTTVKSIVDSDKFIITIGGDHSISGGAFRAVQETYSQLSCLQIDAHSDLRQEYEGSPLSHASVMARIRDLTPYALQLGIRSQCIEEAEWIKRDNLPVYTMQTMRSPRFHLDTVLDALPDPVYITLDVDALDWSVVWSTGTPEPGGFTWDEITRLLATVFAKKTVVGLDVVELSAASHDRNSPFAVAKLIYKMIGYYQNNRRN